MSSMFSKLNAIRHEIVAPYFSAKHKKPLLKQTKEILHLWKKYRYFPYQYFRLALYLDYPIVDVECCMPAIIVQKARSQLNGKAGLVLDDKVQFFNALRETEIPTPKILFIVAKDGTITDPTGESVLSDEQVQALTQANGGELFVKQRAGSSGVGARLFRGGAEEIASLRNDDRAYIAQEKIPQHPALNALNASSVNTLRIVTFRHQGETTFPAACIRIGRAGKVVDNGAQGSVGAHVDVETGKLGKYGRTVLVFGTDIVTRHPDSGVEFLDYQMPFWPEVRQCLDTAARAFEHIPTIGWDVAITPTGPVIVEANTNWVVSGSQHLTALGETRLGQVALEMYRNGGGATAGA